MLGKTGQKHVPKNIQKIKCLNYYNKQLYINHVCKTGQKHVPKKYSENRMFKILQ